MNKSKIKQQQTGALTHLTGWQLVLCLIVCLAMASDTEAYAWQSGTTQLPGGTAAPGGPGVPSQDGFADTFGTAQDGQDDPPEQAFVVNERFAGWREAGNDTEELGETLRSNWVMAGPYGAITGRLAGIEGAHSGNLIMTLLNNGRVVTTTSPEEDASFTFPNVREGAYALVGWGDNAFFAFGFNVLRYSEDAPGNVPTELQVTAIPNKTTINYDWIRHFSPNVKFRVYGRYTMGEGVEDSARLYGFGGLSTHFPDAVPASSISHQPVSYSSNGVLMGRVHQISTSSGRPVDLRNTRIMLLKEDDVFAATTADNYGVFGFTDIPEGEYACVAVGIDGMGCTGITVSNSSSVEPKMQIGEDGEAEPMVAANDGQPIDFTMVPSETIGWLHHQATETSYFRSVSRPRPPQTDPNAQQGPATGPGITGPGINNNNRRGSFFRRFNDRFEELFYNDSGTRSQRVNSFLNRGSQFGNPRPGGYRPR